ncbi:MAG: homocysteine biosynthesis protein [Candidatus Bathyarchaeia archaeon]
MSVKRTFEEVNEKIRRGDAVVVTAEEMVELVKSKGPEVAAKEVDVVTTGTFGAMCSSGAFLNFGHSDPPIKMEKITLNGVEAYHGNSAVDCYIGVTRMDPERPFEYGGGHVIEDLVAGKTIHLEATAYGTDCYPRRHVETDITIHDLNQAILCNPRNAYQRYVAATNGRDEVIYTYMGKLLPDYGNATYSGSGCLNPLSNDPDYETIGVGTRIFLGGGVGYVIGEGTQHDPKNGFGTLMVKGDLKQMNPKYLKGASFTKYGTSMYVGIGVPIPVLNVGLAAKTGVGDEEISTNLLDYGVPRRERPILKRTDYQELKSGKIVWEDREIPVEALSSLKIAREIALELKKWIEDGEFLLTKPVETLPLNVEFKPMKVTRELPTAGSVMIKAVTCEPDESLEEVASKLIEHNVNHIVVVKETELVGIVTSFDVTKAVALGKTRLEDIMTRKVVIAYPEEPVESCVQKMSRHDISALPVVDRRNRVMGIVTSEVISRLLRR